VSGKKRFGMGSVTLDGMHGQLAGGGEGEGGYESVSISRIELDPKNPRNLGISKNDAARGTEFLRSTYPDASVEIEKLEGLSQSIRSVGVIQPIRVYRVGDGFKVAFGERRVLASILAEKEAIPAIILSARPNQLRLLQLTENIQRSDLGAWLRLCNIEAVIREAGLETNQITAEQLSGLIGLGRTQCIAYLGVIRGPEDVRDALASRTIRSLDIAYAIARISEPERRAAAIAEGNVVLASDPIDVDSSDAGPDAGPASAPAVAKGRGRPTTSIALGATSNPQVVRRLVCAIDPSIGDTVDWTDLKAARSTFKSLLERLEREAAE
jgi:ParB family transcriptional regulator, chromosome partitioning protein